VRSASGAGIGESGEQSFGLGDLPLMVLGDDSFRVERPLPQPGSSTQFSALLHPVGRNQIVRCRILGFYVYQPLPVVSCGRPWPSGSPRTAVPMPERRPAPDTSTRHSTEKVGNRRCCFPDVQSTISRVASSCNRPP
jgi:hypothetical protein